MNRIASCKIGFLVAFLLPLGINLFSQARPVIDTIDISGCNTVPDPDFIAIDILTGGEYLKEFAPVDTNANYTYTWSVEGRPDVTSLSHRELIDAAGIYRVSLTISDEIAGNCEIRATRRIRVLSQFDFGSDIPIYTYFEQGCNQLVTAFNFRPDNAATDNYTKLEWHFGNGQVATRLNPRATYTTPGHYEVFALKSNGDTVKVGGRKYIIPIDVTVTPDPQFTVMTKDDLSSIRGSLEVLMVGNEQHYQDTNYHFAWNYLGDSSIVEERTWTAANQSVPPKATYTYSDSGTYNPSLFVYYHVNGNICGRAYSTSVTLSDVLSNEDVIPNFVIPSSENNYQYFGVVSNGVTPLKLTVLSRTGTKIYEETNVNIEWDCTTSHGVVLEPGVYYYVVEATDNSGFKKAGFFHVFY